MKVIFNFSCFPTCKAKCLCAFIRSLKSCFTMLGGNLGFVLSALSLGMCRVHITKYHCHTLRVIIAVIFLLDYFFLVNLMGYTDFMCTCLVDFVVRYTYYHTTQ